MSSGNNDNILKTVFSALIRSQHEAGVFGLVFEGLEGMPELPFQEVFEELGPAAVYVSLLGAPNAAGFLDWAHTRGWDEASFGRGPTHAVNVRNNAPSDAAKLVLVWREEESPERLHSLVRRGYKVIGQHHIIAQLSLVGAERARPRNEPQEHLWQALASEKLSAFLSLSEVLAYYRGFFEDENGDPQTNPRELLPLMGFLPDTQLLTARYSSVAAITGRLLDNASMVERLQRADEEDRKSAIQTLQANRGVHDTHLSHSYQAFLRISRGDLTALGDITLADATELFTGKRLSAVPPAGPQSGPLVATYPPARGTDGLDDLESANDEENGYASPNGQPVESVDGENDDNDNDDYSDIGPGPLPNPPQGTKPPPRREFSDLAVAAVYLVTEGEPNVIEQLVEKAVQTLKRNEIQSERLREGRIVVQFTPDVRAVNLSRIATGDNQFGGSLVVGETPLDEVLRELGQFIERFTLFDDLRLRNLVNVLERAQQNILPSFEGASLLREYLDRRAVLLPWSDLLATSPLACLVARPDAMDAAQQAIASFERLLSHLEANYSTLRKKSPIGTTRFYNEILSLDMLRIQGQDEAAVLLSPVNPLVLWKYTELASLVLSRGTDLPEGDRKLLSEEVANLPEPLLAIYVPAERSSDIPECGYWDRLGSLPVYRPISTEATDLSPFSIRTASKKLAALYPPVRKNLRILLVNPISTNKVSAAIRKLTQSDGFERATVLIARLHQSNAAMSLAPDDKTLDELVSEERLTVEELEESTMDQLTEYLTRRPVHILGIAGVRRKNVEIIESEGTRLHPLSLPHRLHADPLEGTVELRARSIQAAEGSPQHPFGLYHALVSELTGKPQSEFTQGETPSLTLEDYQALLPYCQFLMVTGDLPEQRQNANMLQLTQGIELYGDTVFSHYSSRIVHGMDAILRRLNYQPSAQGLAKLLDRIQEIGGEGLFATISDKSVQGFSETALRGRLGLAVALNWYISETAQQRHIVISLDSYLAKRWLKKRLDGKRTDLIGIRQAPDGSFAIDIIEVKSYEATDANDITNSHPVQQLRSVAQVMYDVLQHQGDILIDRRRELLRRQVYREGLASKGAGDPEWVTTLNDILDGATPTTINLVLIELQFEANTLRDDRSFPFDSPTTPVEALPVRRLRFGEPDIQRYLEGLVERIPVAGTASDAYVPPVAAGDVVLPSEAETPIKLSGNRIVETRSQPLTVLEALSDGGAVLPAFELAPSPEEQVLIARTAQEIYRVLQDIGIKLAAPVDPNLADVGPSIVRYKIRLQTGEKVSALESRTRDLMRELGVEKEPIIENVPRYVAIDLPRPTPQQLYLMPFLPELTPPQDGKGISCPIGMTADGKVEWLNLADLPHMLVAGSTRSGKSMFLTSLIVSLSRLYRPEELQLVLIDPKRVDFLFFNRLPHLHGRRVISDPAEAVITLTQLLSEELERRTTLLEEAISSNIWSYNDRNPEARISPIVVIIDEFADLSDVMDRRQREHFDLSIRRLAQRARNVGIHLILATQRPTVDVVNGTLKSNLPCRVSFRLASQVDSRTILDRGGAENLLGNGDMLVSWNGKVLRLQGFYLPEEHIISILGLQRR